MAEQTPLLDRLALEKAYNFNPTGDPGSLPNLPFKGLNTPLPTVDGQPTPSALSAIENQLLSGNNRNGPLMGGSPSYSLANATSARYDVYVPGNYNNEDAYAQGQGWTAKMVNGVGKGLSLTGTTLLQSTLGMVNGVGRAITDGRAASFYDNEFNRALDDWNKKLENSLPNYYTDVEKNANWYSPSKLLTANFLWDGIVKNMGFAAGAYLSGGVYTAGLKALPLTSRLFSVGKGAEALAATEQGLLSANKVADTYGKVKSLSDKFLGSYNLMNPGGRALVAGLATTGEAGFEAYHNLNEFRNGLIEEFKSTHNGQDPIGADLDKINSEADNVGNSSFMLNTALLTATNYIQFPKMLGSSYNAEKGMINSLKNDISEIATDASGNFIKKAPTTMRGRVLSTLNNIRPYTFSTSEGFEEGAQYAIGVGAKDYYRKKYDGDVADFLESMAVGAGQVFTTDEGMENVLIGGLSGAIMMGKSRFKENAEKSRNTADALQKLNNWKISDFTKATVDSVNRGTVLQQERETALRQGDILTAKDKEADYIINYLTPRIKYGRYDLVKSDINDYRILATTDEGFAQLQSEGKALPSDTKEAYLQRLSNLEQTADNVKSLYQSLTLRYGNLINADKQPVYSPAVMDQMIYSASKIADYDKRSGELMTNLLSSGITPDLVINGVVSGSSDEFNTAIDQINEMKVNADIKESLIQDLSDISEIALRRDRFLKEYDQIKNSPQSYKEQVTEPTQPVGETVTVNTKDGEEEIIVGEEYYLGKVTEYNKDGKEVYRFPKLRILGENEDGSIKIQDSNGETRDIDAATLAEYKLGKVSDTQNNKKAKFFMENANSIFEFNFSKNKKVRGRLEFSPKAGILTFVYKNGKGKIKEIEVTADQFVPKKGFSNPIISKVGALSPQDVMTLEEFVNMSDSRQAGKKASRLKILNDLFEDISASHTKTQKLIEQKKKDLENTQKQLTEVSNTITSEKTPKTGKLKKAAKAAISVSIKLIRTEEQLLEEIKNLESERDELELNATYVTDLEQNIDQLPTSSQDFLAELKDQKDTLEYLTLTTQDEINSINKLINGVQDALEASIKFVQNAVDKFTKSYPNVPATTGAEFNSFLDSNPNFLKLKPEFISDLRNLEDLVSETEDLDITPNERSLSELKDSLSTLQSQLAETEKELKAKNAILDRFEEVAKKYKTQQIEEAKLANDDNLRKELLASADPGIQTKPNDNNYEPDSKKSNIAIVSSTKSATKSDLPHHVRSNVFGSNFGSFSNRENIKGVYVTSKNEVEIGLPGLTNFLKGTSDVDASKIVALVMVQDGNPVGVDGQVLSSSSADNAIFQVMPDPKLEWSQEFGGGTMFRKGTTSEQIEYYKKQYSEFIKEIIESPSLTPHNIEPSFGIPEYVTYLNEKGDAVRDYNAQTPVINAGLIKKSDLTENNVIKIGTVSEVLDKGSTVFTDVSGRVFLNLPTGYVKLQNRKLTLKEVNNIYNAVLTLSKEALTDTGVKSEKSVRIINWLKSTIYWGTPKTADGKPKPLGYNSIFFTSSENGRLVISGGGASYPFTPSSIEQNKGEIIALLEGMYNNINSTKAGKSWNEQYEEITNITPSGEVESTIWDNYQTYLLTSPTLPLSTQIKPISEGEVNRHGIYFTIKDNVDRYAEPTKPVVVAKPTLKENKEGLPYILDGKTINTFVSRTGKKIRFVSTKNIDKIIVVKGGDFDSLLKQYSEGKTEKEGREVINNAVKIAITEFLKTQEEDDSLVIGEDEEESTPAPVVKETSKPVERQAATISVTKDEESFMIEQMDDMEDEIVFRAKLREEIQKFEGENWVKIEAWLKANFPNLPVYRVKNVIQSTNGAQAWGMLKDGAIYVYENAEVGTIYHEVFEGVRKMFLTPTEITNINTEFRNRKGSFIDRPTGKTVKFSEATDSEIKEQLAEEFRAYVLSRPKKNKSLISQLFSDIIDFIKTFFQSDNNTQRLFDKINTGYFKQFLPYQSNLAFAKEGFIDIEEAFASANSEFRIANIPADVVNDIMQHMTYQTLKDLVQDNKGLFSLPNVNKSKLYVKLKGDLQKTALKARKALEQDIKEGKLTNAQAKPGIEKSIALWKSITNEWEELVKKHTEYLRIYNIEFDENDIATLTDEDRGGKGDWQDATKIDNFKKSNSAIKLLLSTLPRVTSNNKLVESSINGVRLLPTTEVFMAVMNKTHNSRTIDEMLQRIKIMSEEDNNYKTLYNRLTKNDSDLSELPNTHDAQLLASLWRTFKKQNPDVKNVYIFENGDVEVGDSNLASAARQISSEYNNAIVKTVKSKNPYFEYSQKEKAFIGKPSGVKNVKLDNDQNRILFLKSLGIEFNTNELAKLNSDKIETFREATAGIKKSIEKSEKIVTINRKVLDINGRLMQLSLVRATIENPEFDSTFFNVKGERTQSFIGTNPVSDLFDYVSQITNKEQLLNTPFEYLLTDSFSKNSVILNKIFNPTTGNKIANSDNLLKPGYADGTINTSNGKKKQSAKLTYKERIVQEANLNLQGYYYNLVPGDSSTEWMVYMGNAVTADSLLSGYSKINSIFKGYFLSELELSRENRPVSKKRNNKDLRFMKPILGEELHNKIIKEKGDPEIVYTKYESQINTAIEKYIKNRSKGFRTLLESYGIVANTPEGITVQNLAFSQGGTITEPVLMRNLEALEANYIINNIELHKVLYSDPYQYSDELKRVKNANSPRQSIINNSPAFNASLTRLWNEGFVKEDIGYTDMTKDYFNTVTLEDVISTSDLKDYGTFEETDGGGIISMKANRFFRIKAGEWNDLEEKQYRYDIAYEKQIKGIELTASEEKLLKDGNPEVKSAYTPLKPIVFGNKGNGKNYNDVVLDKFALYPLSFRIVHSINPESNAVKQYNKMQRENTDYGVFGTGRKVGNEGSNVLYNEDGSFNQLPYRNQVIIPHSIIAIQSEVPSKDEPTVTRGSQITKLSTLDYMEVGIPIDFKGKDFKTRFENWNKLTEKQKLETSPLYKEIKNNQDLLNKITNEGYESLLKRMGIKQGPNGNFVIEDFTKVSDMLESEILKREVNDNIIDAFQGFKNGDVVLEATPAYQQIRNVLYSIADKNVISPKISGGQKVQIASTLLESVRAKKEKGAFTSDVLKFYEDKDGQRVAEIMVGRWFDSNMSDEKLLDYLNKTEEGQKILEGIAFRIPTQKQNSIDSFRIKQFLPAEFGDSVVIPSALVKKVGSDFDIDKLFIYFKNVILDDKGRPVIISNKGSKEATIEFYSKLFDKAIESEEQYILRQLNRLSVSGEFDPETEQRLIDKQEKINKRIINKEEFLDKIYKKALENDYIQSTQNLVSNPLNFENLVKPNSADQLKNLSKDVTKKLGIESLEADNVGNMLDREFMSRLRQAFVSGKYAIGIAAVNQTNHSLNQRQPIYIDQTRFDKLSTEDKVWLTGGTMNPVDATIKFKKFNKIEINGRIVATLSMIQNADGENISDIIGQFIDGYVDISKGPWIMELGATPNVAGTWLFLIKAGVPINDVAYFMNQPIIKDYLKNIETSGYSWLFIDNIVDDMMDIYSPQAQMGVEKEIPSTSELEKMIGKKNKDLSNKQRNQQQFILTEFLKYAKMANQNFLVTQGSNFDTATMNDPYLIFKKTEQLKKAQSTIISSVDSLMKNSFVGNLAERVYDLRDAFSTILSSDTNNVRETLENVLRPYVELGDRDFLAIARKAVNDLFDWAVQIDRGLNNQVKNVLLSDSNTAKQVSDFVVSVRKDSKHPLYNNQVIKLITPHYSQKENTVNNLKIKNKDNKIYDQNQMIYAFAELKNYLNGQNNPLYGQLVRLAVLQSGLSNSPISFTSLLPYEDFKEIYNKTLSNLDNMPNLQSFAELNVFERNNWTNDDIVPVRKAQWKQSKSGEWKYNNNFKFFGYNQVMKAIGNKEIPQLVKINTKARESSSDIIVYQWEEGSKAQKAEMKKKGDYSYIKKGLFKKIYQGDEAFTISFQIPGGPVISDYIYKSINAWGDSHSSDGTYFSANEFYDKGRPSVIDNGFLKVEKEMADSTILTYFNNSVTKPEPMKGEDTIPSCA